MNEGDDALAEYVGLCLYAALWYIHILLVYPTVRRRDRWLGVWEAHEAVLQQETILRLCDALARAA